MDLTVSGSVKVITLAAILAVFAIAGWRVGAPNSFNAVLADAGMAPPPVAAPVAPPAASTPTPAPSGDSAAGH